MAGILSCSLIEQIQLDTELEPIRVGRVLRVIQLEIVLEFGAGLGVVTEFRSAGLSLRRLSPGCCGFFIFRSKFVLPSPDW